MDTFPCSINTENDLIQYEDYIEKERKIENQGLTVSRSNQNMSYIPQENANLPKSLNNTAFLPAFLSKHIGKLIKIESLIGGNLEPRIGVLLTVGANFVVLRQFRSNNTMLCDSTSIKYVTIIHDNDIRKLFS